MVASTQFRFANVLGSTYTGGNVTFAGKDGKTLLSAVGNRIAVFDLVTTKSRTLPVQTPKDIARLALSPDGNVLIAVDLDGRALLINFVRGNILHHFNFKKPVKAMAFSPNGRYILVAHGSHAQVWRTPSHLAREFAPFVKHREYTGHFDDVISVQWAEDGKTFLTTSKDMTAKLFTLDPLEGFRPLTFAGHREAVVSAHFAANDRSIYTVSRDGALLVWKAKENEDEAEMSEDEETDVARTRWGIYSRHYFHQPAKTICTSWHARTGLLVVGFDNGVFGLWDLSRDDFELLHTLSISQEKITSVTIGPTGEWLALGAAKLGQLIVWEWQSGSYILKQQGHFADTSALAFSPDGRYIATGGDDAKVKLWDASSGFCFVTFSEHSSAITAVEFAKQGSVIFSASLDGTVRAFDLGRYRNFRTFTSPDPVQFTALAVDPSGEVVCAAGTSADSFQIFVWSTQTGRVVEMLNGHEGPVSGLAFSPLGDRIVSSSWDQTARIWELFGKARHIEPLRVASEALCVAYRPDGNEFAVATLNGQVAFFDVAEGRQTQLIDGRKDIMGGRKADDRRAASNSHGGACFTSLTYTADGNCVLAGGNSPFVCLYDIKEAVLLKRWAITDNLSLDGLQRKLDSRKDHPQAGQLDLIDDASDDESRQMALPGARGAGDLSQRKHRREARSRSVKLAPTGRSWAAATVEGVVLYSLDVGGGEISFDPIDLDVDITPATIAEAVSEREMLKAIVMALRLGERSVLRRVYEAIDVGDIKLLARSLPSRYAQPLLAFVAYEIERGSAHVEYNLRWTQALLAAHGADLKSGLSDSAPTLRELHRGLSDYQTQLTKTCVQGKCEQSDAHRLDSNTFTLSFFLDQAKRRKATAASSMAQD